VNDSEVVDKILQGETELYETLVRRYQVRLFYWVLNMVADKDEAEEICQQSFVSVYTHLGQMRNPAAFSVFLFRTALNQTRDYFRNRQKLAVDPPELVDPSTVSEEVSMAENRVKLQKAINELPEKQRLVVSLRVVEGFGFSEIGRIIGTSANSARVNFHHAIRNLRTRLGGKNGL
jgi:RNA polymerase sigma-70 factor (ECF subfamily)